MRKELQKERGKRLKAPILFHFISDHSQIAPNNIPSHTHQHNTPRGPASTWTTPLCSRSRFLVSPLAWESNPPLPQPSTTAVSAPRCHDDLSLEVLQETEREEGGRGVSFHREGQTRAQSLRGRGCDHLQDRREWLVGGRSPRALRHLSLQLCPNVCPSFSSSSSFFACCSLLVAHCRRTKRVIGQCRVLFDFHARYEDELSISVGDVLSIHAETSGWFDGSNRQGGFGMFPCDFVELL